MPKDHYLGDSIEGKDSIRIRKNIATVSDLKDLCKSLIKCFEDDSYKNGYDWIDNMAILSDPSKIHELYTTLIGSIKSNKFENMYFMTPIFIDNIFEYEGFVFSGDRARSKNKQTLIYPDISDIAAYYGKEFISDMNIDVFLKTCKISLRDEEGRDAFTWSLSRCIYWETILGDDKFILCEGIWYRVSRSFYGEVEDFFANHVVETNFPSFPAHLKKEAEYNFLLSQRLAGAHLFDLGHASARQKTICGKNEICDVFLVEDMKFVHVKPGKSSDDISHLIRQAAFSAKIIKTNPAEYETFKHLLGERDAQKIPENCEPAKFSILFLVILDLNQSKEIPFFSKVSFKDAVEGMKMAGYKCEFGFVFREARNPKPQQRIAA